MRPCDLCVAWPKSPCSPSLNGKSAWWHSDMGRHIFQWRLSNRLVIIEAMRAETKLSQKHNKEICPNNGAGFCLLILSMCFILLFPVKSGPNHENKNMAACSKRGYALEVKAPLVCLVPFITLLYWYYVALWWQNWRSAPVSSISTNIWEFHRASIQSIVVFYYNQNILPSTNYSEHNKITQSITFASAEPTTILYLGISYLHPTTWGEAIHKRRKRQI